ncbi:MAG: hypothetical protein M9964_01100 [Solirubrobacterales bacterium]|nr:hypothetical protein [Solirubrobacterales bacterium]
MGPNGAGKSTLLRTAAGVLPASFGSIEVPGGCALLSQRPDDYLVRESVGDELPGAAGSAVLAAVAPSTPSTIPPISPVASASVSPSPSRCGRRGAGGAAPGLVCLDEPTRGLDRARKDELAAWIEELAEAGSAVVVATHDVEFAARFASRVVLLARGRVIADADPREALGGGWYFATETARITGGRAVTPEQGAALLGAERQGAER